MKNNFYRIYKETINRVSPITRTKKIKHNNKKKPPKKTTEYAFYISSQRGGNFFVGSIPDKGYNGWGDVAQSLDLSFSKYIKTLDRRDYLKKHDTRRYVRLFMYLFIIAEQLDIPNNKLSGGDLTSNIVDFVKDYWINIQTEVPMNWKNIDNNNKFDAPASGDISVYLKFGKNEWEKIRFSEHLNLSSKAKDAPTHIVTYSKDILEKIIFKKDGNILNFLKACEKEYDKKINSLDLNDFPKLRQFVVNNKANIDSWVAQVGGKYESYYQELMNFIKNDDILSFFDKYGDKKASEIFSYFVSIISKVSTDMNNKNISTNINKHITKLSPDDFKKSTNGFFIDFDDIINKFT